MTIKSSGQDKDIWTNEWKNLSIESEIQMWDYFGMRPWIVKYTPRHGKVIEAGCGLGRYNFYLSHLGIDISGLDFSAETIEHLKSWQKQYNYDLEFIQGDITSLPFKDNSLRGYLSFGVVEHFIEGPQVPIREAFRVLEPGGIAIISTPAPSWSKRLLKTKKNFKQILKKILGRDVIKPPFFQYEYSPRKLKKYIEDEGFLVNTYSGGDMLFTFAELGKYTDKYIHENSFGYKLSHKLENSIFKNLGAQSIVIAIKPGEKMHCFFCGAKSATPLSLKEFDVPVCPYCKDSELTYHYKKGNTTQFHQPYKINPPIKEPTQNQCNFCTKTYTTDSLFEDFGFSKNICQDCLKDIQKNIRLVNTSLQPIWRKR
ncbi:MAG: methyltransferase domain-containing protein [Bacteroidales bacterium]|nr:methyltransferase domain-containing protein [Bacteroidales bacterium]